MKILIYLLRKKQNKEGKMPLYVRFTENSQRAEMSTGIFINPDEWDNVNKAIIGTSSQVRVNNTKLYNLQIEAEKILEENPDSISVFRLKEIMEERQETVRSERVKRQASLIEVMKLYIGSAEKRSLFSSPIQ